MTMQMSGIGQCLKIDTEMRIIHTRYTLMEVVAAMGILCVILGLAVFSLRTIYSPPSLDNEAEKIRTFTSTCRRSAIAQGKNIIIFYLKEGNKLFFNNEAYFLSDGIFLKFDGSENQKNEPIEVFHFRQDGTASSQKVQLTDGEESIEITTSPITGLISIQELNDNG